MTSNTFWSHLLHIVAGIVIVAIPLALANIPQSWQALTVGGILGLILSFAKNYLIS